MQTKDWDINTNRCSKSLKRSSSCIMKSKCRFRSSCKTRITWSISNLKRSKRRSSWRRASLNNKRGNNRTSFPKRWSKRLFKAKGLTNSCGDKMISDSTRLTRPGPDGRCLITKQNRSWKTSSRLKLDKRHTKNSCYFNVRKGFKTMICKESLSWTRHNKSCKYKTNNTTINFTKPTFKIRRWEKEFCNCLRRKYWTRG